MNVEKLIELLEDMDSSAQVLIEGAAETFWSVRSVDPDESGKAVFLVPGAEVPVTVED